jgi:hypothetical protein
MFIVSDQKKRLRFGGTKLSPFRLEKGRSRQSLHDVPSTCCFSTTTTIVRTRLTVTFIRTLFVLSYVPRDNSVQATGHGINNTATSELSNVQIRLSVVHYCSCVQLSVLNNAARRPAGCNSVTRLLKMATSLQKHSTK